MNRESYEIFQRRGFQEGKNIKTDNSELNISIKVLRFFTKVYNLLDQM